MTTITVAPDPDDKPGPSTGEIVYVTPQIAERWLASNTGNRQPRRAQVAAYASDMAAGDWRWTGDPIRFDYNGRLIDGQHRLMALIDAQVRLPFLVLRGLEPEAQENIDGVIPRKFGDVLALRGEPNANALAAIVRKIHDWTSGTRGRKGGKATHAQLLRTLEAHPEIRDVVNPSRVVSQSVELPPSLIGLAYWLFDQIDTEDTEFFFARLRDGQSLVKGDPIYELRNAIAASKSIKGDRNHVYLLAVVIKAWNAYRRGESVGQLKFRVGGARPEQFPEPI